LGAELGQAIPAEVDSISTTLLRRRVCCAQTLHHRRPFDDAGPEG